MNHKQVALLFGLFLVVRAIASTNELVVYTYDSFVGKGSLGELVKTEFSKKEKLNVRFVSFSSAGEALNQIAIEGKNTKADILVGVDNNLLSRARNLQAFEKHDSALWTAIEPTTDFDKEHYFVPFDYGFVAVIYDDTRWKNAIPKNLADLSANPLFTNKIALTDPRTSSLGLSFLLWTKLHAGDQFESYWNSLRNQIFTVSPGWSGSYGLFLKGGVDFVVSYTTSPAYHVCKEMKSSVKAVIFPEGHYRQIEGVAVVKYSKQKVLSKKWIATLLSPEVQANVATSQWMYPARKGVLLPQCFDSNPRIDKPVEMPPQMIEQSKKQWIHTWNLAMAKKA